MADRAGFENRCALWYRGFESHPLRFAVRRSSAKAGCFAGWVHADRWDENTRGAERQRSVGSMPLFGAAKRIPPSPFCSAPVFGLSCHHVGSLSSTRRVQTAIWELRMSKSHLFENRSELGQRVFLMLFHGFLKLIPRR